MPSPRFSLLQRHPSFSSSLGLALLLLLLHILLSSQFSLVTAGHFTLIDHLPNTEWYSSSLGYFIQFKVDFWKGSHKDFSQFFLSFRENQLRASQRLSKSKHFQLFSLFVCKTDFLFKIKKLMFTRFCHRQKSNSKKYENSIQPEPKDVQNLSA